MAGYKDVAGIINRGGTKIGSARSVRFMEPYFRNIAAQNLLSHGIDKLVVLGGDGSFRGMEKFYKEHGVAFCGVPSTIDNDIAGTDYCLGVDTALNIIKGAIDAVRDTAASFKRAFVIETMGRDCGYLALVSAITSGAELCLIPELPYDLSDIQKCFRRELEQGRRYFIAVVAEGYQQPSEEIAEWFSKKVGVESRVTVLGHIQRGGNPTVYDREMAYRFVTCAIDGMLEGTNDSVICYTQSHFTHTDINSVANGTYQIDPELLRFAKKSCHL